MKKQIDWSTLGFSYYQTDSHIHYVWRDGKWDAGTLETDPHINLHVAATSLHYGQAAFEGMKAFGCKDGAVRLFRPEMNARRLNASARRLRMAEVPEAMFLDACRRVIDANRDFVPPYGSGGSMYVRPLLIGGGAQIGVAPSNEYHFLVMVMPVGAYYKGGFKPVRALVLDDYDRAAPMGTGSVKAGGNYGAAMEPHMVAHDRGFPVELYLDAREHAYIEEFGTSNFVGITKDGRYVTPKSPSILPSITNDSLQQIARDLGIPVEVRPVPFEEIGEMAEVAACGTAVVITPVNEVVRGGKSYKTGPATGCGPTLERLYRHLVGIQHGDLPDTHGWCWKI